MITTLTTVSTLATLSMETRRDRLREFRFMYDVKQEDIADLLGIPRSTWASYEKFEEREIPMHFLKKLEEKYKLNKEWVLTGKGDMMIKEGSQINKATSFGDNAYIQGQTNARGNIEISQENEWMRKFYEMVGIANERQRLIDEQKKLIDDLKRQLEDCLRNT